VHVVVAPVVRVVPDLGMALARIHTDTTAAGSCTTLITGPSRTADIEKKLVLGVHGPCALHVILIELDEGAFVPRDAHASAERSAARREPERR
jgi:L-lactate dehydrogenase complex protein LldG